MMTPGPIVISEAACEHGGCRWRKPCRPRASSRSAPLRGHPVRSAGTPCLQPLQHCCRLAPSGAVSGHGNRPRSLNADRPATQASEACKPCVSFAGLFTSGHANHCNLPGRRATHAAARSLTRDAAASVREPCLLSCVVGAIAAVRNQPYDEGCRGMSAVKEQACWRQGAAQMRRSMRRFAT